MVGKTIGTLLLIVALGRGVCAYRPFDSTDAAVAGRGEIEVELGPIGYLTDDDHRFLVVPATVLNLGVADRWEVVLEGRGFVRLCVTPAERRMTLGDAALSVKGVLRRGTLQGRSGPSVATEIGLLLPAPGAEPGMGASAAAIVSQRWSKVTLHVNGLLALSREHRVDGFVGAIVEGPVEWAVRPVAEVSLELGAGNHKVSGLVGGIWQVREHLALDAGVRLGTTGATKDREIRAGLTWAFALH